LDECCRRDDAIANTLIFIRHAKTKKEPNVPIERWVLAEEGLRSAQELAESGIFDDVDVLVSSDENKAYLTLKPLADKLKKKIMRVKELGEIKRPNSESLPTKEYEEVKARLLKDIDYTERGWETANHALNRFQTAVNKVDREYDDKKLLICAHGTVLTLYFAALQNKLDRLFSRWKELEFGSYGVVQNGKVVKDIV